MVCQIASNRPLLYYLLVNDLLRTNALDFQGNGAPTLGQNLFTVRDLIEGASYLDTDEVTGTGSLFEDVSFVSRGCRGVFG